MFQGNGASREASLWGTANNSVEKVVSGATKGDTLPPNLQLFLFLVLMKQVLVTILVL